MVRPLFWVGHLVLCSRFFIQYLWIGIFHWIGKLRDSFDRYFKVEKWFSLFPNSSLILSTLNKIDKETKTLVNEEINCRRFLETYYPWKSPPKRCLKTSPFIYSSGPFILLSLLFKFWPLLILTSGKFSPFKWTEKYLVS